MVDRIPPALPPSDDNMQSKGKVTQETIKKDMQQFILDIEKKTQTSSVTGSDMMVIEASSGTLGLEEYFTIQPAALRDKINKDFKAFLKTIEIYSYDGKQKLGDVLNPPSKPIEKVRLVKTDNYEAAKRALESDLDQIK